MAKTGNCHSELSNPVDSKGEITCSITYKHVMGSESEESSSSELNGGKHSAYSENAEDSSLR